MKQQVMLIHGGSTFDTYEEYVQFLHEYVLDLNRENRKRWKEGFAAELGSEFEVIQPQMPSKYNAKYAEWEVWFEKYIPFLRDDVVLVGHSLGGIFLAKYLSEKTIPVQVRATILIAAPFSADGTTRSLADFAPLPPLGGLVTQGGELVLMQSRDDNVVSFSNFEKYIALLPEAEQIIFEDKGHFSQETFPELVAKIKELAR